MCVCLIVGLPFFHDISPGTNFQCKLPVFVQLLQLPCAITCVSISEHVTNPSDCQLYQCVDTQTLHTLAGMGGSAPAAAVALPE